MSVFGYVRVSTDEQLAGSSIEDQKRAIQGAAMMKGLHVDHIFEELGVSASIPLDERPAGAELVARLQRGDWLICAKLDRAFRSALDALTRAEGWKRQGVLLVVLNLGTDAVTENGVSKMVFTMLAAVGELERTIIAERTAAGRASKRAKGGHIGGTAPFGYRVDGQGRQAMLVPVPEQQDALLTIRQMRLRGATLRVTADRVRELHGFSLPLETVRRCAARG